MSGISQPPARQLGPLAMAFWDLKKAPRASRLCVGLPARVRAGSAHLGPALLDHQGASQALCAQNYLFGLLGGLHVDAYLLQDAGSARKSSSQRFDKALVPLTALGASGRARMLRQCRS